MPEHKSDVRLSRLFPGTRSLAAGLGLLSLLIAAASAAPQASVVSGAVAPGRGIAWRPWSDEVFAQAKREHKFVILDLEAVWCHWCHVMDATTYKDPRVMALIAGNYLAVRVDQDSRPDLANRYEDYGWPATVIYGPDGKEIAKKRGYVEPAGMRRLLQAVVDDPSPVDYQDSLGAQASADAVLPAARREALVRQWAVGYDEKEGGWGFSQKFLDWDTVEFAQREAQRGDMRAGQRARDTLRLQQRLLDPAWGGVYQYSVGGGWNEPHFEKIMAMQAENLRIFSLAYAQWGDPAYLHAAQAIHGYLKRFLLSPEGAFYTSQDADLVPGEHSAEYFSLDDAGRRARGVPRIDHKIYARENGWAIAGLGELAEASGDTEARDDALAAARWVLEHRAMGDGGYRHGEQDPAGPYLGDTLAMARACLVLHELTADPVWLARAEASAHFIAAHFARGAEPGFATSDMGRSSVPVPEPQYDENIGLARLAASLSAATGKPEYRGMGDSALRWLLTPGRAERRHFYVGGVLLAEEEVRTEPLHVVIVGRKTDPEAAALYAEALKMPTAHRLVEWWDRSEGPAPRGEDIYPDSTAAAAFVCDHGACSAPLARPDLLSARLRKLTSGPVRSSD